uniref:Uncharacterized protein n=1 Tax=Rhizophora mucronata TaxID=61149 RepID=A0A2P2PGQ5_RHIMU
MQFRHLRKASLSTVRLLLEREDEV